MLKEKIFRYSSEKNIGGQIKRIAQNFMWFDTVVLFIGGIVMFFLPELYIVKICGGFVLAACLRHYLLRSWHM